eukprot:4479507-Pyramimonas_sp.AAC.1
MLALKVDQVRVALGRHRRGRGGQGRDSGADAASAVPEAAAHVGIDCRVVPAALLVTPVPEIANIRAASAR